MKCFTVKFNQYKLNIFVENSKNSKIKVIAYDSFFKFTYKKYIYCSYIDDLFIYRSLLDIVAYNTFGGQKIRIKGQEFELKNGSKLEKNHLLRFFDRY